MAYNKIKPLAPIELFWRHVECEPNSGCWLWTGALYPGGYGKFACDSWLAHRFSYEYFVGKIRKGLEIDHLCKVRSCVNPKHLEAVTNRVNNIVRSNSACALNSRKTHCSRGHEYIPENTQHVIKGAYSKKRGLISRICRECNKARAKSWRDKKKCL